MVLRDGETVNHPPYCGDKSLDWKGVSSLAILAGMIELRPATPDEMPAVARLVSRSLALDRDKFRALRPEMTLCVFEDDRLATVHGSWPLTMRMNGVATPISGVTTVSTDPIDRQRGFLRLAVRRHFEELHQRGERPLAVLFASQAAIYQRFGYAVVSTHHRYQVEPRYLQFCHPFVTRGRLRELDAQRDFGILVDLYRAFREDKTGYVHRGRPMWEAGALAPPEGRLDQKVVVVYEEDASPLGYCIYTTGPGPYEGPEPTQRVVIHDLVWLTPAAYQAFWVLMSRMHLARYVFWHAAPPDDPLPELVLEPRMLRDTAFDGMLARVVDVERALGARGYDAEGSLRFTVRDDLCTWNDGGYELTVEGGHASVRRTEGRPEPTMTVHTLAKLLFGHRTATQLASMGLIEGADARTLAAFDAVFRTRWLPFSPDRW